MILQSALDLFFYFSWSETVSPHCVNVRKLTYSMWIRLTHINTSGYTTILHYVSTHQLSRKAVNLLHLLPEPAHLSSLTFIYLFI